MQKIIFSGNITKDSETREISNGKIVTNFSVAVKRPYSKDTTDFFDVVAYDKLGETCSKYLSKGKRVLVEGYMTTRSYEDKQGNKRKVYEVRAETVEFLNSNSNGKQEESMDMPF